MPIYEFYCPECNVIFNFLSKSAKTHKQPPCPRCKGKRLQKEVSGFAVTGRAAEPAAGGEGADDFPVDEARMERAMEALASEADRVNEDDPRAAAQLMRKFSKMAGVEFGGGVEEAINRMEAGEDPEAIEAEMGDALNDENPFVVSGGRAGGRARRRPAPERDAKLYDM